MLTLLYVAALVVFVFAADAALEVLVDLANLCPRCARPSWRCVCGREPEVCHG